MATLPRFLILDACVLIDLSHVDRKVMGDVCRSIGSVHVVRAVFDEVQQIDEAGAVASGLTIVDPELADLLEAARVPRGALSFQDRLCLMMAARQGWVCVSNDRPLRSECMARDVPVLWGLEMLGLASSGVALIDLESAAWAIHEANPRYVPKALVEKFLEKLRRK